MAHEHETDDRDYALSILVQAGEGGLPNPDAVAVELAHRLLARSEKIEERKASVPAKRA